MKILPIEEIRKADAYTIEHEPISDIDLMERAATELHDWILAKTSSRKPVKIFCGLGNNGGDGFALGRMLAVSGFQVTVFIVKYSDKMSDSCRINYERAGKIKGVELIEIEKGDILPKISNDELIVDAIFGSGLTRPITGFIADIVEHINGNGGITVSIDAPSGFFCDSTNKENAGGIVKADYTLSFQFPKLGFLFPENDILVGQWVVLPIGLHPGFIEKVQVDNFFVRARDCRPLLKPRSKFAHKGTFGHGLLIAGGYGKMGAALLAAKAGLKSGAGLITAHIPEKGNTIVQTAVPEAMVSIDPDPKHFSEVPKLAKYNAIAIGPGIGTGKETQKALKTLVQNAAIPLIFDADALNILSENKTWIPFIPPGSIFTPHPGEFQRLIGKSKNDFERNKMQRVFSVRNRAYVILKGAHTAITCPDGSCYFNSTGNPGMATGGSGDVLTGILLGLMAQGYSSKTASILGVFLHGLAGDFAAEKRGYEALIAGDIVDNLGKAFRKMHRD
ncbi:MAG: NAD(P)H-hydrate dehydratase [Chlorobi bacterium]|nr:NAD(P)H-hydrate dehydratase [Chlorobiota bacterium]